MNDRIIELSGRPTYLSVENGLLTLDVDGQNRVQIPPGEVAAVVAAHYAITFTREAVATLADHGAQLVVCDKRGLPAAMLLPLRGFHQPASRLILQAATKRPVCKRLWRQVVRSKVRAQGATLLKLRGDDAGLPGMAISVRSGDPGNVEGVAARVYWRRLFDQDFRRDTEGFDQNRFLNYGYGVLRAVTCRAICAAGLHPGLGLHHHHRANPFCLADDLMEPFRPLVDAIVFDLWHEQKGLAELTPLLKKRLLEVLTIRLNVGGEDRGLFDVLCRLALSLAGVIEGRRKTLVLPTWGELPKPSNLPPGPEEP
jgi:CRISPR-associated protein Cas1